MSEQRFASAVPFYVAHRPRYPAEFVSALASELGLDGTGRLLDLGCGPGFVAIAMAPYYAAAVGVDPEPLMLEAAREESAAASSIATFELGSSETLDPADGPFRTVTMGRSFHWMDRTRTLVALDAIIEPDGAVVLLGSHLPEAPENAWRRLPREIADRFSDDPDHPRHRHPAGHHDHAAVLAASPFSRLSELRRTQRSERSVDAIVGRTLSMSSTTPAQLGRRRAEFEESLRVALTSHALDGRLMELLEFEAIIARRP